MDRLGRVTQIASSSTLARDYNDAGLIVAERFTSGPLSGLGLTNRYDQYLRRTNLTLNAQPAIITNSWSFDSAGRMSEAWEGTNKATYSYLANSPLVDHITFTNGSTTRMVSTRQHDFLNRLTNSVSTTNSVTFVRHNYAYNTASQRTQNTREDGAYWIYQYDQLGQVTSGKKYWSDGTIVAGQQFEYTFDDIGNRKTTAAGGDQYAGNLRSATYTANSLNQYSQRTVPGYLDIVGSAATNATVTVNAQATYRKGEYFRKELNPDNSSGPVWQAITNIAVVPDSPNPDIVTTNTGNLLLAKATEAFLHDADGNLTSDSLWTNRWDGENRLTSVESQTSVASGGRVKLDFAYDSGGRRLQKIVSTWNGSAYVAQSTNRLVYDGWNLVAELNHTNGLVRSYLWGLDLSGSMQGAGGVGGLLSLNAGTNGVQFVAYDGNGNITALLSATNATAGAFYEYGPFGELIAATGPAAKANPLRFSSKYQDDETSALYYGYRSYNPSSGRWPNRDPLEEEGGVNLYAFTRNAPVNFIDAFGLLVVGAFDIGTGTLTITDSDTGETIVLCGESGGKPYGDPIPTGEFEILDHPDKNFFRLDPVDEVPRNDIHEPTKRDHFRLHKPGRTIGCIAAKSECGDCWDKVAAMIRKTKTENVQVTTQRSWPRGPITETVKKFGDFRVIDSSKNSVPGEKFNPCKCLCGDKK